jgi:hypothetical protein
MCELLNNMDSEKKMIFMLIFLIFMGIFMIGFSLFAMWIVEKDIIKWHKNNPDKKRISKEDII